MVSILFRLKLTIVSLLLIVASGTAAHAEILISEVDISSDPPKIEVSNSGGTSVNLTGWVVKNKAGDSFSLTGTISAGGVLDFDLPTNFIVKRGDILELFDPDLDGLVDAVGFGDSGPAPLHPELVTSSLARVGGVANPTGSLSAINYTVDFSPTFGNPNNAPPPQFNDQLRINEIIPSGGSILAELYNKTGAAINLGGYELTNGQSTVALSGTIAAGGTRLFDITAINFELSLNLYLFRSDEVRIDQLGLTEGPGSQNVWNEVVSNGYLSIGRFLNGSGPQDGFNLETSGFPITLQRMYGTPESVNVSAQPVSVSTLLCAALALIVLAAWWLRRRAALVAVPGCTRREA